MSKQSDVKAFQQFHPKPMCCQTCEYCKEYLHPKVGAMGYQYETRSLKCEIPGESLGGFAVNPTNSCSMWARSKR